MVPKTIKMPEIYKKEHNQNIIYSNEKIKNVEKITLDIYDIFL